MKKTFHITILETFEVEAESEDEAMEIFNEGIECPPIVSEQTSIKEITE